MYVSCRNKKKIASPLVGMATLYDVDNRGGVCYDMFKKPKGATSVKLWVLMENTAYSEDFAAEHGLSLYLETGGRRILFDMGQSAAFVRNAAKLGIDLGGVDTAILSHGHYDHGGGIGAFLECNSHAPVYVSEYAFEPHYGSGGKYVGLDLSLQGSSRLIPAGDNRDLGDGLSLHSCNGNPRLRPVDPSGLYTLTESGPQPECFLHEQYLLVREGERRILISGCSHKGIVDIVNWFRPDVLVGGFHLMNLSPEDPAVGQIADALLEPDTVYYTGHCTGAAQLATLKVRMGDRLHPIHTGSVLEL